MGEDNKNLKELHIIDGATGEEIPVTPIKELVFSEKEGEYEENLDEWFLARDEDYNFEMHIDTELFNKCVKIMKKVNKIAKTKNINDEIKHIRKKIGALPLTKKRARKLLMAHGYDRNKANQTLKFLHKRTLNEIKKYFIF